MKSSGRWVLVHAADAKTGDIGEAIGGKGKPMGKPAMEDSWLVSPRNIQWCWELGLIESRGPESPACLVPVRYAAFCKTEMETPLAFAEKKAEKKPAEKKAAGGKKRKMEEVDEEMQLGQGDKDAAAAAAKAARES